MVESNDPDAGEETPPPSANEPYPWRTQESEPESKPETSQESIENRGGASTNPEVKRDSSPPSSPREQRSGTHPGNNGRANGGQSARSSWGESQPGSTAEPSRSLGAKVLLLALDGLSKLWHLIVLGFYWLLPRITGTTDSHEGVSGRFYPSQMVRDDEKVIYAGHPSRWLSPAPYVLSGFLLTLALVIGIAVPLGYGEPLLDAVTPSILDLSVPEKWWYAPLLFTGVAILLLLYVVITRASIWHVVTDKRLIYRRNVLATNRSRIDLVDVNSINCRQPFPERWYGVGYIDIYTSSTGDRELVLEGVKDAPSIAKLIDEARYDYQQRIREGYPEEEQPSQRDTRRGERRQSKRRDRQIASQDPGANRHTGTQSMPPTGQGQRDGQHREPHSQRQGGREARDHPENEYGEGAPADTVSEQGDSSIEQQRPDHTLHDDIGGLSERDDR